MKGGPEWGNPQEPICNLAGAEVQGGFEESACLPAREDQGQGSARGSKSYFQGGCDRNLQGAISGSAERAQAGQKSPSGGPHAPALLGIYTGTPASRASRGFQPISQPLNLVDEVDSETGEITRYEVTPKGRRVYKSPQQLRAERYALKSVVNHLFPQSRTAKCCRVPAFRQNVRIVKAPEVGRAFYGGLCRCGSVWLCPVDAATIAERRRAELVAATATAKAMGWQVMLMTCTVPHGLGDDLDGMLDRMLKAWRKMTDDRKGKDMRKLFGFEGTIRAIEVTDGRNGFHPHFHVLLFLSAGFSPESVQAGFAPLWQDACVKAGLPCPSDYHGLRVDDGSWAERYVTKWGLEDEMVRGHMKASKGEKGMTPWDLLRDILWNGSTRSEERFRLYAEAFKGRRQLYWSNGLKEKLGVGDVSDEELVAQETEHGFDFHRFKPEHWRAVLATHSEAVLLAVVEENPEDFPAVMRGILRSYRSQLKRKSTAVY